MVRLLHHYETSTHRIFLLLEYVGGGRLLDFVNGKRAQWKKLHEAVTNPPPSSSLIISADTTIQEPTEKQKSTPVVKEDRADESSDTQQNGKWMYHRTVLKTGKKLGKYMYIGVGEEHMCIHVHCMQPVSSIEHSDAATQRRLVTIFVECTFNYCAPYAMYCFC